MVVMFTQQWRVASGEWRVAIGEGGGEDERVKKEVGAGARAPYNHPYPYLFRSSNVFHMRVSTPADRSHRRVQK